MIPFNKIHSGLDVAYANIELEENEHLFGQRGLRKNMSGVHSAMSDIWVRYKDITECEKTGDYSTMNDEHDSVWLHHLQFIKQLCFSVMTMVDGERLGGVLITKLPAGGRILPHVDKGWHAGYYSKCYIPIKNKEGAIFKFGDNIIEPDEGDVWMFDNSVEHEVINDSSEDRIAMVVCVKQSRYQRNGKSIYLGGF